MRIKIDLPDWVDKDQTILVLSGQELIAFKDPKSKWKIKKVRCDQCGECCLDVKGTNIPFGHDDEHKCNALKKKGDKYYCTAGPAKPFCCLRDPKIKEVGCNIRYF